MIQEIAQTRLCDVQQSSAGGLIEGRNLPLPPRRTKRLLLRSRGHWDWVGTDGSGTDETS
jgi:hypothetical protein